MYISSLQQYEGEDSICHTVEANGYRQLFCYTHSNNLWVSKWQNLNFRVNYLFKCYQYFIKTVF